jgi:hypothetical protein
MIEEKSVTLVKIKNLITRLQEDKNLREDFASGKIEVIQREVKKEGLNFSQLKEISDQLKDVYSTTFINVWVP